MDLRGLWAIHDNAGRDLTPRLLPITETLTVRDRAGVKSDEIELALKDDPAIELPLIAKGLTLYLRRTEGMTRIGSYFVTGFDPSGMPSMMRIVARSVHFGGPNSEGGEAPALADTPRTNAYENTTLGAATNAAAARLGVSAAVDPDVSGFTFDYVEQEGESDIAFISRLARSAGVTAKLTGDTLAVGSLDKIASYVSDEPLGEVELLPDDVGAWSAHWDVRRAPGTVAARWHDTTSGEAGKAEAGTGKPPRDLRRVFASEAEANRAAIAEISSRARKSRSISLPLSAIDLRMWVGTPITLPASRWRDGVAGKWSVAEADHVIGRSRASTHVRCEPRK